MVNRRQRHSLGDCDTFSHGGRATDSARIAECLEKSIELELSRYFISSIKNIPFFEHREHFHEAGK
jgi:hypothetical protein